MADRTLRRAGPNGVRRGRPLRRRSGHRARRTLRSFLLAGLLGGTCAAAVLLTGSGAGTTSRALADFPFHGRLGTQTMTAGRVLGSSHEPLGGVVIRLRNGTRTRYWYCISYSKHFPGSAVRYGVPVAFHGTSASRRRSDIGVVSMLIQRYGMRSGSGGRDAVDIDAAEVSAQVSRIFDEVNQHGQWNYLGLGGTSKSHAGTLLAAARKLAGPYTVSVPALPTATPGSTYTRTLQVRNAFGPVGAGVAVSVVAQNARVSRSALRTDAQGRVAVRYTVPATSRATSVRLTATTRVIDTMRLLRAATTARPKDVQDFVSAATVASTYRGSARGPIRKPVAITPVMSTQTSAARVAPGAALTDTVDVNGTAGHGGTVVATLYGPADSASGPWTTVAGTVSLPVAGDGTYVTPSITVTRPGLYTWAERFTLTGGTSPVSTTQPGIASETTVVTRPTMTTQTSDRQVVAGAEITDEVRVSGTAGACGHVTATLYGPASSVSGPWTVVAGKVGLDVCGDGTYTTPAVRVSEAGTYSWGEGFVLSGATSPVATTRPGDVAETTVVTRPTMSTQVSAQHADVGAHITDRIEVTGTSGSCGKVVATLYGPADSSTGPWTTVAARVTVPVCGDGTYTTPAVTLKQPGLYSWAERFTITGQRAPIATTRPGVVSETTRIDDRQVEAASVRIETGGTSKAEQSVAAPVLGVAGGAVGVWLLVLAAARRSSRR